jgi:NTP pyrophosphatase (non-canonical NTP hydrolase)
MSTRNTNKDKDKMGVYATVSGSFNRFLPEVKKIVKQMNDYGIVVLSPKSLVPNCSLKTNKHNFVIFEGDRGSPSHIEIVHLRSIARSDFLYLVNPEGYVGVSAAFEIGFAISKNVPIFSQYSPNDCIFADIITSGMSIQEILENVIAKKKQSSCSQLKESPSLHDLQDYVFKMVKSRGFSDEGDLQIMLLLMEEIGELAKAIRYQEHVKVSNGNRVKDVSLANELADCLIYLLDLANVLNIDMEKAFREKEIINSRRKWVIPKSLQNS